MNRAKTAGNPLFIPQVLRGGQSARPIFAPVQKHELSASLYEREMTFTVEGDLNREERRDIFKALKGLGIY